MKSWKWILPPLAAIAALVTTITGCAPHRNLRAQALALGHLCMSPTWYGITLGKTSDGQVVSVHGASPYRADAEDGRGRRYYKDASRSLLMVSHAGSDKIVNSLTISVPQEGADLESQEVLISPKLHRNDGIARTNVHLGSTRTEVRNSLGVPEQGEDNAPVWFYLIDCDSATTRKPVELVLVFEEERIVSASFSERADNASAVTFNH